MAVDTFADGYQTTLSAGASTGATSIVPTSTTNAPTADPTLVPPKRFRVVVQTANYPTSGSREVVTVTDSRTGTWTCTALANTYASGAIVSSVVTKAALDQFIQTGGAATITMPVSGGVGDAKNGINIRFDTTSDGQAIEVFDHLGAPIWSIPAAGGPAVYGDMSRAGPSVVSTNFVALDGSTNPPSIAFPPTSSPHRLWFTDGPPSGTTILAGTTQAKDLAWDRTNGAWYICTAGGTPGTWRAGLFATQPTVTGSRGGNAALASLLTALAGLGLIVDSSS